MHSVQFYFDFISPYAWLALLEAEDFARKHEVIWSLEPVVYAGLLNATGLVGPVETDAKRIYTFDDVVRCATRMGHEIVGPPTHPFRSIEALRTLLLFREDPKALELAVAISDGAWGHGLDLTDVGVLKGLVERCGLDVNKLDQGLQAPETKSGLIESTTAAVQRGVFGVPTFEYDGELFWGHDRMVHLAERLTGKSGRAREVSAKLLERGASARRTAR